MDKTEQYGITNKSKVHAVHQATEMLHEIVSVMQSK